MVRARSRVALRRAIYRLVDGDELEALQQLLQDLFQHIFRWFSIGFPLLFMGFHSFSTGSSSVFLGFFHGFSRFFDVSSRLSHVASQGPSRVGGAADAGRPARDLLPELLRRPEALGRCPGAAAPGAKAPRAQRRDEGHGQGLAVARGAAALREGGGVEAFAGPLQPPNVGFMIYM